jgi:hypothetical protein
MYRTRDVSSSSRKRTGLSGASVPVLPTINKGVCREKLTPNSPRFTAQIYFGASAALTY